MESEYDVPTIGYSSILTLVVNGTVKVKVPIGDGGHIAVATGDGVSIGGPVHEGSSNVGCSEDCSSAASNDNKTLTS